ncbi:MAG: hypothetical protein OEW48_14425 [Phycisphaerae bacterium]|nr:hypothetical protein [Phycisphaerae bacterium]
MNKDLKEYRTGLIQTVEKLNDNYDKLIITLSGGALALSLSFLKDIIKDAQITSPEYLILSWGLFIMSLTSVLGSLLFGIAAHKKAIKQVDAGTIYKETPGGFSSKITTFLHYIGTAFLIAGLVLITIFIYSNMEVSNVKKQNTTATAVKNSATETTGTGTPSHK